MDQVQEFWAYLFSFLISIVWVITISIQDEAFDRILRKKIIARGYRNKGTVFIDKHKGIRLDIVRDGSSNNHYSYIFSAKIRSKYQPFEIKYRHFSIEETKLPIIEAWSQYLDYKVEINENLVQLFDRIEEIRTIISSIPFVKSDGKFLNFKFSIDYNFKFVLQIIDMLERITKQQYTTKSSLTTRRPMTVYL